MSTPHSPFNLPRILVAEDDSSSRAMMLYLLDSDYDVTVVVNGEQAINALDVDTYDLLLLDLMMPEVDGFEVLRMLQSHARASTLPVIVISALEDKTSIIRALHLGAKDYVTKPLDLDVLVARIETQLGLQRMIREQQSTIKALALTRDVQRKLSRIISHDLKSPLTNFGLGHYMLREIMGDNPEAARVIENMELTLNAIVDMIGVFVEAIEAQELRPTFGLVNTRDLVRDVVAQHQLIAERKFIRLEIDSRVDDTIGLLWGDGRMLNQALSNLTSNAIKFSPQKTLTRLWVEPRGRFYRICVQDQGPGLSEEDRKALVEGGMFNKLSNRPTGGESSTGLGLWIVRQLVELHHGAWGIENPPEGGALFWIEIPTASEAQINQSQPGKV